MNRNVNVARANAKETMTTAEKTNQEVESGEMKRYAVVTISKAVCEIQVDARNEEEAKWKAHELDVYEKGVCRPSLGYFDYDRNVPVDEDYELEWKIYEMLEHEISHVELIEDGKHEGATGNEGGCHE